MRLARVIYPMLLRNGSLSLEHRQCASVITKRLKSDKSSLTKSVRSEVDTNVKPIGEKIKENTKTASYLGIILIGVGVTGTMFYAIFRELFSSQSPNNVYSAAVKRCLADTRVEDKLGLPIASYGEESRRRRRQHVSYNIYNKDGKKALRMRFYLQGAFHKGTVNLEMCENDFGKYEYRYLFVDVDDMARSTIVLEDNRLKLDSKSPSDFNML